MPLVLLVEDDPAIRRALSRALTDAGYAVRAVDTALDALRAVTAEQPAVVLLDLGLPDMDGSHALVMIRAVSAVPIIVATARRGENETIRLLNAGADDYVTKPFSAAHVLARVAAVLRRGRPVEPGPPPALEVEIQPLVQKVHRKRRVWESVFRERNARLLDLLERFGGEEIGGLRRTVTVWPSVLPSDTDSAVRNAAQLVTNGIQSRRTAVAR